MPRGGPRPNSGGARPGAGRKPRPAAPLPEDDPQGFLTKVMQGEVIPSPAQLAAATALLRAAVKPAGGVKLERQKAAEDVAAGGKFRPRPAPLKLVASG